MDSFKTQLKAFYTGVTEVMCTYVWDIFVCYFVVDVVLVI